MKKFLHLLILSSSLCSLLAGGFPGQPAGMPQLSEQDLESFVNMIESLPQEVRDELTKTGEAIIKRAEELGEDPFELIAKAAEQGKDVFEYTDALINQGGMPEEAPREIKKEEPAAPKIDKRLINSMHDLINNILKSLNSFKEKIVSDREKRTKAEAFQFVIDDLIYYLEVINEDKLLTILHNDEFSQLRNDLRIFHDELIDLESQLIIEELALGGENPYGQLGIPRSASHDEIIQAFRKKSAQFDAAKKEKQLRAEGRSEEHIQSIIKELKGEFNELNKAYDLIRNKERSSFIFDSILRSLTSATDTKRVIDEMKNIIKVYEPEALKIKAEREKLEEAARKEQERARVKLNITTFQPFTMPSASSFGSPSYDYGSGYKSPFDYEPSSSYDSDFTLPSGSKGDSDSVESSKGKKPDAQKKKEAEAQIKGDGKADKEKEKDKQAAAKKKKDEMPAGVNDAIVGIKLQLKSFEGAFDKIYKATEIPEKQKKDTILAMVNKTISSPYNADEGQRYFGELERVKKDLEELRKKISGDLEKVTKTEAQKSFYKQEIKALFDKFEQTPAYQQIGKLILDPTFLPDDSRQITRPITAAYQRLIWGTNIELPKKGMLGMVTGSGLSDDEIKFINEKNPIKDRPDYKNPDAPVKRGMNFPKQIHELYKSIKQFDLDDKKRSIKIGEL